MIPEGQVNTVGIYFADVELPLLSLYQRGVTFHTGKGMARPAMTPVLERVADGILHPQMITSGVYDWDRLPEVLTSPDAGHKPVFTLTP